ncbi:MAG: SDR family NAD(P)-dependent oxidoreductase [Phycisphaerae bacterium]
MPLFAENLKDANVLVTGGSNESGPFLCRAFADAGANVATTWHSDQEGAGKTADYVRDQGGRCETYPLDLFDIDSVDNLIEKLKEDWERLDVVVLCVGSKGLRNFRNLSWDQLDMAYDGNVKANFMLAKELGYWMKETGGLGRIIQLSAASAENASDSAYGMAKAAQRDMAEFLAWELAPEVTVNTIQPIGIDQDPQHDQPPEDDAPLGRKVHARDIGKLCVLMCDPVFDSFTGELFRMDGGRHVDSAYAEEI